MKKKREEKIFSNFIVDIVYPECIIYNSNKTISDTFFSLTFLLLKSHNVIAMKLFYLTVS